LIVSPTLADVRGNSLQKGVTNSFWVLPGGKDGDADGDDLTNGEELRLGTNPVVADTDGDGWKDGFEVLAQSNPLDPKSVPQAYYMASPPMAIHLSSVDELGSNAGTTLAHPPLDVYIATPDDDLKSTRGLTLASPPIAVQITDLLEQGITLARPPLRLKLPQP
jgi:hypothetical protein